MEGIGVPSMPSRSLMLLYIGRTSAGQQFAAVLKRTESAKSEPASSGCKKPLRAEVGLTFLSPSFQFGLFAKF
jgi:hypothetical protein